VTPRAGLPLLGWVNSLDTTTNDLSVLNGKIATEVKALRATAIPALQSGKALPVSAELHLLQQQRIGLLVRHMIKLRKNLGPAASASLDGYLDREFAAHVSLKALAHPPSPISKSSVAN
jgi:hypothetical protein